MVSAYHDMGGAAGPASLILVEQSGAKHEIPQLSLRHRDGRGGAGHGCLGLCLREVKVVSQHRAIARWKAGERGWRRVV